MYDQQKGLPAFFCIPACLQVCDKYVSPITMIRFRKLIVTSLPASDNTFVCCQSNFHWSYTCKYSIIIENLTYKSYDA